jgi:hypothetical protein
MSTLNKFLFFFLLPTLAIFMYPPAMLVEGWPIVVFFVLLMAMLAYFLYRGKSLALTFSIFLQGMNVIIRLMMFFPNSVSKAGSYDIPYLITSLVGLALSMYLALRLDERDVRITMVS